MRFGPSASKQALGASFTAFVLIIAGCGGTNNAAASKGVLKIGAIQPISGPFATLGKEALDGMKLATDLVNSEGGVNGKQARTRGRRWADGPGRPLASRTTCQD